MLFEKIGVSIEVVNFDIENINIVVATPIGIVEIPVEEYLVLFVNSAEEFFEVNMMVIEALKEAHEQIIAEAEQVDPLEELLKELQKVLN